MKNMNSKWLLTPVLLVLLAAGCTLDAPESPEGLTAPEGDEIFAGYVAIGNSLTAGYMDSGLMVAGQRNSYPMLMATQMGLSSDDWMQPYILPPGIGTTDVGEGLVSGVLHFDGASPSPLGTTATAAVPALLQAAAWPMPYNNLGVPGARLAEVMGTYNGATSFGAAFGDTNKFFDFINRASFFGNVSHAGPPAYESASLFGQAVAKGPSLVTLWIGANDVLRGALSGEPISYPAITDPTAFGDGYGVLLGALAQGLIARTGWPATIVVATIPQVSNTAYFLSRDKFMAAYGVAAGSGEWTFEEGASAELILLPDFLQWLVTEPEGGGDVPYLNGGELPAAMTLDTTEREYLESVINGYNTAINATALYVEDQGWAQTGVVDINEQLEALTDDERGHFMYLRQKYYLQGGGNFEPVADTAARTMFSLDGVHPNNMGYAYLANAFMTVVNELTGESLIMIPPAAMEWDPTYADYGGGAGKSAESPGGFSEEAVTGIKSLFR